MFQLKTRSEWEFAYWTLQHAREFDEVLIKNLKQKMRQQLREEDTSLPLEFFHLLMIPIEELKHREQCYSTGGNDF